MARCVVTVVGMADRMTGTSQKTGKAYDMQELAITFVNQWGNNSVACCMVDGQAIDQLQVKVGCKYDSVINQYNGKAYLDLIEEVS